MDRAQTISAIGHAAVILWLLLGDWLFSPNDVPPPDSVQVSMVSSAELQAMQDAAPKPQEPAETPPEPEPTPEPAPVVEPPVPVTPDLPPAEPEPLPELPEELPVDVAAQPVEAPPPVAPIAAEEQPVPVPETSTRPQPRPVDRVAAVPVDDINDTPEVADTATPETTDQPEPDAPVVTEEQPAASPQEATTQIVTEANEAEDAPQLAPTSSRRPQSRPARQAEAPEEPAEIPVEVAPDVEADAIAAALAEAAASEPASEPASESAAQNLPEGPPMSASEVEGLRLAINQCWNVGALSTEALNVVVTLRVEMTEEGKPDYASIRMTDFAGGSAEAAQRAFEAGRSAITRCGRNGFDLDPAKFGQWNVLNLVFDPSGMRLR